VSTLKKKRV